MRLGPCLLAVLIALVPTLARAQAPKPGAEPGSEVDLRRPTRVELGLQIGDYLLAVGSPTQLQYAPVVDLRLALGRARVGALGFVRLAAPLDLGASVATRTRQLSTGGGLGLRSIFVQRPKLRGGLWLAATVDRLDSRVELPALPGLSELDGAEHWQRRVTHHAGLELGHELGLPLSVRRGPTPVLTLGAALTFVFPIAAARSGTTVTSTRYEAKQLGLLGVAGGATLLLNLGVTLAWEAKR